MTDTQITATDGTLAAAGQMPRLMIQKIVMENFKSYYGEVTIGPFNKNMTSVVGPNGSGKSNVIDSMLFVFGFNAKKMRQGKVSELIHASDQHKDVKYVKVSVYFQDILDQPDGTYTVVEGSELVVSREAKRDNTSTYRLNGKASDYKAVSSGHARAESAWALRMTRVRHCVLRAAARVPRSSSQPLAPAGG